MAGNLESLAPLLEHLYGAHSPTICSHESDINGIRKVLCLFVRVGGRHNRSSSVQQITWSILTLCYFSHDIILIAGLLCCMKCSSCLLHSSSAALTGPHS